MMSKRVVLCFDGTWNTPYHKDREYLAPTNVYKFYESILPQTPEGQLQKCYYNAGVGTGPRWYEKIAGFFGFGLSENILQGYRKLIQEYVPGDEIFCLGFSRGAYTARSLIGLIRKAGLLKKEYSQEDLIQQAYELYRQRDLSPDTPQAKEFRRQYAIEKIQIKFLGVWDTVGSLGIPKGLFETIPELSQFVEAFNEGRVGFHDTKLSSTVEHAYHALAIDEHRQPYEVALWSNAEYSPHQKVEQRWFIGAHANVGGGYQDARLSDIALKWMQDKAEEAGLVFKKKITHLAAYHRGELRDSYTEALGGLYPKLFGKRSLRKIDSKEFIQQSIDESVLKRIEDVKEYRPQNVLDSLSN